jgi:dihydrodipicolinate synthase/N-acetylneuraminate lyase
MRGALPTGVVAGPANALPREWARAWQVCRAGDLERMEQVRGVLEAFRGATGVAGGGRRTIACLKRALFIEGVISSPHLAPGTPALSGEDAARFEERYDKVKAAARAELGATWTSTFPGRPTDG